mgnify:CR=1 FL=1
MFYYLVRYSFDPFKPVFGPFKTESEAWAAALADGISQGAAEKEQNMIVGMLKENVNINTIAKVAQMTVEQVAAIGKKAAVL